MLAAFTFLLAMLIPNVDVGDMDLGIYGGHLGELYRLFLASMLSIFIYVIFFEILNQALLWIAPLHYAALLEMNIENLLNQSVCSLPPLWLSFCLSGSPPLAWATVSEATFNFCSPERSL